MDKEKGRYSFIGKDKRVIERNLRRNALPQEDLAKHLKGLEDDQELGEEIQVHKNPSEPTATSG